MEYENRDTIGKFDEKQTINILSKEKLFPIDEKITKF